MFLRVFGILMESGDLEGLEIQEMPNAKHVRDFEAVSVKRG